MKQEEEIEPIDRIDEEPNQKQLSVTGLQAPNQLEIPRSSKRRPKRCIPIKDIIDKDRVIEKTVSLNQQEEWQRPIIKVVPPKEGEEEEEDPEEAPEEEAEEAEATTHPSNMETVRN